MALVSRMVGRRPLAQAAACLQAVLHGRSRWSAPIVSTSGDRRPTVVRPAREARVRQTGGARVRHVSATMRATKAPRELHDRVAFIMSAACAEAGYPIETEWVIDSHKVRTAIPAEVLNKARILACEALGIEWEWRDGDA